ncbi:electron transport complex subunit RsxC [Celerinatantimonas yamalensis]|uniref:Ion-translocating oxidoreductase complex subunit C n=1 Tax=Celerinatantimonas yamalensis TaxID=559956 RepID=A0ABW9G2S1_9GAMM
MTLQTFEQIQQGKLWHFQGGIHPNPHKKGIDTGRPTKLDYQGDYILHPHQHIGDAGMLTVAVGDYVLGGQALTQSFLYSAPPIHAPTSGSIVAIEPRPCAHPSAREELAIMLRPDGQNNWQKLTPVTNTDDRQSLIQAIHQSGISGMGGAGFPTAIKLASRSGIELLVVNGAECEPYISADDTLMQHYSGGIRQGIKWLQHILQPKLTILAIEDDKPCAIAAMLAVADDSLRVQVIPAKYPSGGEKQLIQILTGTQVPAGSLPADIGIMVQNVGTAYAVHRAIDYGEPLTKRIVTLAGNAIKKPRNIWVDIGTPVAALLPEKSPRYPRLIMGGAMMGYTLPSPNVPLIKTSNCILYGSEKEFGQSQQPLACIRCGECAQVCPADLLPQQLFWFIQGNELDKAKNYHLKDCIECGACAYVCPSKIPLVEYYRRGKVQLREQQQLEIDAERARQRTERRNQRLEREKQQRELRHQQAAKDRVQELKHSDKTDAIAAAMARVKAKQQSQDHHQSVDSSTAQVQDRQSSVAAAVARAKAKRTMAEDESASKPAPDNQRKAAVAAAIARAKAKRQSEDNGSTGEQSTRKATVNAAVARAKAKRAQTQTHAEPVDTTNKPGPVSPQSAKQDAPVYAATDKKALIAAVAKAKAKKAAEQAVQVEPDRSNVDKKAAIAAAVAKARAKKTAEQAVQVEPDRPKVDKKAAIAAAAAKAKAKKTAESDANASQTSQSDPIHSSNEESSNL